MQSNKLIKKINRRHIKRLSYLMYFYFVCVLVIYFAAIFIEGAGYQDLLEYFSFTLWLIIVSVLGIVFAYNLGKMKKWALIALIVLILVEIIVFEILAIYFEEWDTFIRIPGIFILPLALLLNGRRYFESENQ